MASQDNLIITATPRLCENCNEEVYKWLDVETLDEYWATWLGRPTCGSSQSFHIVSD